MKEYFDLKGMAYAIRQRRRTSARHPDTHARNFGTVEPGHLYRGAWPDARALAGLKAWGVTDVLNLAPANARASDLLARQCRLAGLGYHQRNFDDRGAPDPQGLMACLALVAADEGRRVWYAHCAGGRHRTGAFVMLYRLLVQKWTWVRAWAECHTFGFYEWRHRPWAAYLESLEPTRR
jgi:protein tyrosine/serine phosphatase